MKFQGDDWAGEVFYNHLELGLPLSCCFLGSRSGASPMFLEGLLELLPHMDMATSTKGEGRGEEGSSSL